MEDQRAGGACLDSDITGPAKTKTTPNLDPQTSISAAVKKLTRTKAGKVSKKKSRSSSASAESMAKQQREISISEFFARNRHLLGFDNKRKALLTSVKEAVDNALDACEEGGVFPEIYLEIKQLSEDRFRMICRDNGPGIVKAQIPNIFGKLLYGSKFHRLKMSRGQQGIGISAAGMYGLITTGKPVSIISRTGKGKPAHHYKLAIDTKKNKPDIIADKTVEVPWDQGTEIEIEMVASFNKGRQSVAEYIELTAIANPHTSIVFKGPDKKVIEFLRNVDELPEQTEEIKPHPHGVELGVLMKMLKETGSKQLGAFLNSEFSRVSPKIAKEVCAKAGLTQRTWLQSVAPTDVEKLYNVLQETKLRAPSTNCLAPIGAEAILNGLLKGIKAEFYTASTRPPSVYRGNPFQIEVGMAFGGQLGSLDSNSNGNGDDKSKQPQTARVIRFANRVPLLYQQGACCTFKSVVDTKWNNYGLSQSRSSLPQAPFVVLIHMASVWVPFTSESKEAIADYDEIRKEIKLGLSECGRRLGTYIRRKKKRSHFAQRRDVFHRYIHEIAESCGSMTECNKEDLRQALHDLAVRATEAADMEFDDHGKIIAKRKNGKSEMDNTIVLDESEQAPPGQLELFAGEAETNAGPKRATRAKPKKTKKKKTSKKSSAKKTKKRK
ncbi:MAG: DNA topoisomerase VI subunit B [Phycisphaerae bacterium]|nr:MAG: DNA topoisomerase VI subunit B [Phycisphaerae bacterium]